MKKYPGSDDITTEMLLAAVDIGIAELTKLSTIMYSQCCFLDELNKSIFMKPSKINGTIK